MTIKSHSQYLLLTCRSCGAGDSGRNKGGKLFNLVDSAIAVLFCSCLAILLLRPNVALADGYVIVDSENPSSYMRGTPPPADRLVDAADDWYLDADKARWSFQNLSKILPIDPISRGNQPVSELIYSDQQILNNQYTGPEGNKASLRSILSVLGADGFIALKNGKVLAEIYFNGMQPETRHVLFSVTKSFVGTLVGVLVDQGKIDPQQLVTHYLPELSQSGFAGATVRDLLDMVAGTQWNKTRSDPASLVNVNAMAGGFIEGPADFSFGNTLQFLQSLGPQGKHGYQHVYNASHTEALAWIISRISGKAWQSVLSDEIWSKLGTERDAFVTVDKYGHGFATAGMSITLRDLARFGLMLQNRGKFNGSQIVAPSWIDTTVRGDDKVRAAWSRSTERKRKPYVQFYKNQFRVVDSEKGEFYASGYRGQKVYVDQSNNFVAVIFSMQPDAELVRFHVPLFRQISESVAQMAQQ